MNDSGGKVFRVVTENYPGCPLLTAAGAPAIRTEYLMTIKPLTWGLKLNEALLFSRHLDAVKLAQTIPHCHATVCGHKPDLRAESASSTGAGKQAESFGNIIAQRNQRPVRKTFPSHGNAAVEMIGNRDRQPESVSGSSLNDPGIPQLGASREREAQAVAQRANKGAATLRRPNKRTRMAALKRAHERVNTPEPDQFWWRQGQFA